MKLHKILIFTIALISSLLFAQNLQELQKLQDEYKKVLERQSLQKPEAVANAEKTAKSTALPDKLIYSRKDIESLLVNTEKLLKELRFYEDSIQKMPFIGYDFFTKRDSIPFWQNLPISKSYILGPGDEVIISLWGESNSYENQIINRDGQIFIEKIGMLNIGGKSIDVAKDYITSKYSRVYSTLISDSPKSFIDLTLGELKSVNVHFVGFVNIPGVHLVHPFSTVVTGLIQAGGVDIKGTLRDIKIIRNGEIISNSDIYDYLISAKTYNSSRLLDQDIVYVPPRKSTIAITGRVLKPGYYETLPNETLEKIISFSGGLDTKASDFVQIHKKSSPNLDRLVSHLDSFNNIKISKGDSIHVPSRPEIKSFVMVGGQIKNPGKYPFNKDFKLKDIFNATMSKEDFDFYRTIDLTSIKIFRKNDSGISPLRIITSLDENIKLQNGDHITFPKKSFFEPIKSVVVTGEINAPGNYPINNLTTLQDIVLLAGGLTELALEDGIEIYRDSLKIAWEKPDIFLAEGDSLRFLKKTGLILVTGEVNSPGYVSYKKNISVKKYLKKAGGFTSFADKKNIYVIHPNGTSIPVSTWSQPIVKEGSTIIVSQRTISGNQNISGWEAFSIISSQAGSIATTLLSLSILINQSTTNNGN